MPVVQAEQPMQEEVFFPLSSFYQWWWFDPLIVNRGTNLEPDGSPIRPSHLLICRFTYNFPVRLETVYLIYHIRIIQSVCTQTLSDTHSSISMRTPFANQFEGFFRGPNQILD